MLKLIKLGFTAGVVFIAGLSAGLSVAEKRYYTWQISDAFAVKIERGITPDRIADELASAKVKKGQ